MNAALNWQRAASRTDELKRLEASSGAHPFARFVYLVFRPQKTPR